ncbi:MAG: LysM domain, partial [Chloroflexota bacterium]|nr:LysM domain [Chloroflexota bacterium]
PTPQVSLAAGGPSSGATGAPTPVSSADPGGSASPSAATGSGAPGSAAPAGRTYRVKAGETLLGIANRFGISYKALAQLNGIVSPYNIKSGQVLKLP